MATRRLLAGVLAVLVLAGGAPGARADEDLTRWVDPMIGTFGSGFVFPGAAAPYGMVQLSPDTEGYFAYTGYLWSDSHIRGFSHVHIQSMGVRMGGNVPFMPTVGPVTSTDPLRYMSGFDHANEDASPGYYRVLLRNGVEAELTAGLRTGVHRYTFPPGPQANVLIDAGRSVPRAGGDEIRPGVHRASLTVEDDRTVSGSAFTRNGYTVHFWARFDRPFTGYATWDRGLADPVPGRASVDGEGAGAYVTFDALTDRDVEARVGISFVSVDNARENLEAEDAGFEDTRERTREAWNDALHAVEVSGGEEAFKTSFYTALYHAQHHPNVFTDADGTYMGHDGQAHQADGYTHYANFSLWDTYRGEMQLLATIAPDRYRDMVRSLHEMYAQRGAFPQWALNNAYPDYMIGEPVMMPLADAFCRDLVPPDIEDSLYAAMRAQLLEHHRDPAFLSGKVLPGPGRVGGASETMEHALAAFAAALVADRRGEAADRDEFLRLASHWRNAVDPSIGFARPFNHDGTFKDPYDPMSSEGFVEGTGWQYTWDAPHDPAGLFQRIGGLDRAREMLDTHFSTLLSEPVPFVVPEAQKHITLFGIAYHGNQYAPSNEHELHAPYLFDWTGEPWKTQAVVRGLQGLYRPTPDGLPGNDDLGSMSAWFIWSALGFNPTVAGAPLHTIGSPLFEEARIRLPGGHFTVRAPGASVTGKYVQGAELNGSPLGRTWFEADEIVPGGELTLEMGPRANRAWGADGPPPSMTGSPLGDFGCS